MKNKDRIIDYLKLFVASAIVGVAIGLIMLLTKKYSASENPYMMLGYFPAIGILLGVFTLSIAYIIGKMYDIIVRQS